MIAVFIKFDANLVKWARALTWEAGECRFEEPSDPKLFNVFRLSYTEKVFLI